MIPNSLTLNAKFILSINYFSDKKELEFKPLYCNILVLTYTDECKKKRHFTGKKEVKSNSKKSWVEI